MEAQRLKLDLFKPSHCCARPKSHKNIPKKRLAGTKWGVVAVSLVDASGWVRHNFGCAWVAGLPRGSCVHPYNNTQHVVSRHSCQSDED